MTSKSLSALLQPLRIGPMELKNRMGVTAMGVSLAEEDGSCGERIIAYHKKQAEGGAALITLGATGVGYPVGGVQVRQVAMSNDSQIPGLKRLADAVHAAGAKIAGQIHFGGLNATMDMTQGRPLWCPSLPPVQVGDFMDGFLPEEMADVLVPKTDVSMKVMDANDIARLTELFVAAARRARASGFDGLEIHAGHGYILSSFMSPVTNRRTDGYGGSVENRARLTVEVLRAVRAAAGPDIAVWVKMDGVEFGRAGGITIDDAVISAKMMEEAGADAIAVTSYHDTSKGILHSASNIPHVPNTNVDNAVRVKAAVKIPVICSGRIEPDSADRDVAAGKFDFLYMGRKILADTHLPRKIAEGRTTDIRPCIYCYTCVSQIYLAKSTKCAVSPETAFERAFEVQRAAVTKRVTVVGGGPAGMEAARRLTAKGHKVTLLEQSDRLGGTLQFAAIAYEPNERLLNWLRREVEASAVDVRLKTQATPEVLRALTPDEVIVATGAIRAMPSIPGSDRNNVLSGDDMRRLVLGEDLEVLKGKVSWTTRLASSAGALTGATRSPSLIREVTKAWMPLGEEIVIIGGELVGLELAEFLVHRGRKVTVVDNAVKFGAGMTLLRRMRLLTELREAGVTLCPNVTDIAIGDHEVTWRQNGGSSFRAKADHVIVAKGAQGDTHLAEQFAQAGFKVHVAGDAKGIGYIEGAMRDAAELALKI